MTELLSKSGANIQELNTFRKFFSQTKGGGLAAATYPSKVGQSFIANLYLVCLLWSHRYIGVFTIIIIMRKNLS